jgi:lysine/ornithine N-monooxygenase
MGKKANTTSGEAEGEVHFVTREEFDDFTSEVQKKLDAFVLGQTELANVQADTSENMNKLQAETNSKIDRLTELVTTLTVRNSIPPDFRENLDTDRGSSVNGNFVGSSPLGPA